MANPNARTILVQDATHHYGRLTLPVALNDPPSPDDVSSSVRLARRALIAREHPEYVDDAAAAACVKYSHAVVQDSLTVDGAPQWFRAWDRDSFQPLRRDVTTLLIRDGRDRNAHLVVDNGGPLTEVPFPDGTFPWGFNFTRQGHPDVVLPRLDNLAAIAYYPTSEVPHQIQKRKEGILKSIGRGF